MRAPFALAVLFVTTITFIGAGCAPASEQPGPWVPSTRGPWQGALAIATSSDGLTFRGSDIILSHAGVPHLLRHTDGTLILTYQYFSYTEQDLFDVIAYSTSHDGGTTWSKPAALTLSGLPTTLGNKRPMDPTLVQTEDGALRLYFTYHANGTKSAALYSAIAEDGNIASPFVVHPTPALTLTNGNLLDPAVTFFNGLWHHYSWRDDSEKNYHSISKDGVTFTEQPDVTLSMDFLGHVMPMDNGLRFYGTSRDGIVTAFSPNGDTWAMDHDTGINGADPGVAQLEDGSYLMVYTSSNFNK